MRIKSYEEYKSIYQESIENPEKFWDDIASQFYWKKKWDRILEWNFKSPDVKWFINGKLNITENCIDRHLATQPDKIAIIWEPNEVGEEYKTFTYRQLYHEVCTMANTLNNITMTCDPTNIRCAPVNLICFILKYISERIG